MAVKNSKNQRQYRSEEETVSRRQKLSQIIFAVFAVLLIVSMVISAFATY